MNTLKKYKTPSFLFLRIRSKKTMLEREQESFKKMHALCDKPLEGEIGFYVILASANISLARAIFICDNMLKSEEGSLMAICDDMVECANCIIMQGKV